MELVGLEPTASSLRMTASSNLLFCLLTLGNQVRSITFRKLFKISGLPGELPHSFSGLHSIVADAVVLFSSTRPQYGMYLGLHLKRCRVNFEPIARSPNAAPRVQKPPARL